MFSKLSGKGDKRNASNFYYLFMQTINLKSNYLSCVHLKHSVINKLKIHSFKCIDFYFDVYFKII